MVADLGTDPRIRALVSRLSPPRLAPYLAESGGDLHAAIKLYQRNIDLSGAVYESLHVVEVVLRNALDVQLATWNAAQIDTKTRRSHSRDWLLDPSHLLTRLVGKDVAKASTNASRAFRRGRNGPETPGHNDVLAQISFGTWRFLLPDKDPGRRLLWREALSMAFPHLETEPGELTRRVHGIYQLRNRVAHLEPLLRPGFIEAEFASIRFVLASVDPHLEQWLVSRQRMTSILRRRRKLTEQ